LQENYNKNQDTAGCDQQTHYPIWVLKTSHILNIFEQSGILMTYKSPGFVFKVKDSSSSH